MYDDEWMISATIGLHVSIDHGFAQYFQLEFKEVLSLSPPAILLIPMINIGGTVYCTISSSKLIKSTDIAVIAYNRIVLYK